MALIPADAALRLRLQTEANQLQPVQPVRPIPADLPELQAGQAFTARIVETLPDNTYRALVAGRTLTLSLPQGARTGDTLELVVTDRSANSIIAHLAPRQQAATAAEGYPWANFSRSGQMIAALLPRDGERPPAAPLNRGQPLLANPPTSGAELAPALGRAVRQSGLFYESHQAQWIGGRLPVTQLLAEPQGALSNLAAVLARAGQAGAASSSSSSLAATSPDTAAPGFQTATSGAAPPAANSSGNPAVAGQPTALATALATGTSSSAGPSTNAPPSNAAPLANTAALTDDVGPMAARHQAAAGASVATPAAVTTTATPPASHAIAQAGQAELTPRTATESTDLHSAQAGRIVADELRPLVQQQLEALGSQRMIWHGELWPRQSVEMEIKREEVDERQANGDEELDRWNTTLRLQLPRLGEVGAALSLTGHQLRLVVLTPYESSAADLRAATPRLNEALKAAGLELVALQIRSQGGDSEGQSSG